MIGSALASTELVRRTRGIAREVAAEHAADVDARARFPQETFDALRDARLLSSAVPVELGGRGAGMVELAEQCAALAEGCGSSGMILAMHHVQIACLARHARRAPRFRRYLEECAERQLLVASITSEVGVWGDTRSSVCAVEVEGDRFHLTKEATTVSYGEHADDLLVTCRRSASAPPSDQALVLVRRADRTLTQTSTWDPLGMRGTVSPGFVMVASGPIDQIVPAPFADISAQTMVSASHILWSAVWLGVARDAARRAAAFVRAEARRRPGSVPPAAPRLAELMVGLQSMRNNVAAEAASYDEIAARPSAAEELSTMGWALAMNNLKVAASKMVVEVVHDALQIVGLGGYKNDSRASVGRHYRDALSASLMISNERINAKSAAMLLVWKDDER